MIFSLFNTLQQILLAVNTIHEERIVHSDLKPANFLLVRGSLKLIDFGIAKAIMSDTTNIQRDSQVPKPCLFLLLKMTLMDAICQATDQTVLYQDALINLSHILGLFGNFNILGDVC